MSETTAWPSLPLNEWQDTYRTLHMWTQIVGNIRMTLSPPLNHWWHVTLYVNSRGLTTGPVPYPKGIFEIQLDFQKHALGISTSEGADVSRPLKGESVASFYSGISESLASPDLAKWDRAALESDDPLSLTDDDHLIVIKFPETFFPPLGFHNRTGRSAYGRGRGHRLPNLKERKPC